MSYNMTDTKLCRVCLRKELKLYHYNGFHLKGIYEDIMHFKIIEEELPRYFCFECAAMLYKFHKFKVKCRRGYEALLHIIKDNKVDKKSIRELDVSDKELKSQLDIMIVNERVKTITIKSRAKLKDNVPEIDIEDKFKTEEPIETETSSVDDNVEDVSESNTNKLNNILFDENPINADEKLRDVVIVEKIAGDDKMIVGDEDDRAFSSDDDFLSELKNKQVKSEVPNEESLKAVKVNQTVKSRTKRKYVKGKEKEKKKAPVERKRPKTALESQFWELRQLSEEEAREEFARRAFSPKYLAANFRCQHCFRGFSQEDMLRRHDTKKHSESVGPVVCKFCRCRFRIQCQLTRHNRQHYNLYKCLRCNLVCNLELSALLHEEHHNGVVKKCEHCGEGFTHTSTYYSHLRSHRSSFVCTLCGQSFVSEIGLRYHKTLKHAHRDNRSEPEKKTKEKEDEEEGEGETYCERCKIRFETREAFEQHHLHSAMHAIGTPLQGCEEGPEGALHKARDKALVRRPRAPTHCSHCETTFRTKRGFLKHPCVAAKEGVNGGGGGPRRRGRGRGWVQITPQRKPPQHASKKEMCEICGATVGAVYMRAHINTHTHQRAFACDVCGIKLYSQSSLKRHQLTHTGERPYPCPLCDKRFTQSNSMKLHYRTFHLKEPYPKRNRKIKDDASLIEFTSLQTWSTDS